MMWIIGSINTMTSPPLPTLFFPLRRNWKYCYQLSDGTWEEKKYCTFGAVIDMAVNCKRLGIPFKARLRGSWHGNCFLLYLSSNRLSDRTLDNE